MKEASSALSSLLLSWRNNTSGKREREKRWMLLREQRSDEQEAEGSYDINVMFLLILQESGGLVIVWLGSAEQLIGHFSIREVGNVIFQLSVASPLRWIMFTACL